mmetsp:Transcript_9956/g.27870  ORF Transcript_9956/g.27870 Transcript_9956/m.27870 type:complete len:91 (+) Transcript_9956:145-417(+)
MNHRPPFLFSFVGLQNASKAPAQTLILPCGRNVPTKLRISAGLMYFLSLCSTNNVLLMDGEGPLPLIGGGRAVNLSDGIEVLKGLVGDDR